MQSTPVARFSATEAREKIGQRVRSLTAFAGVPRDTAGTVVDVYEFDNDSFDVFIEWDLPGRENLRDRFAKGPYEEFLREEARELAYAV
jgi:hypothetical protein